MSSRLLAVPSALALLLSGCTGTPPPPVPQPTPRALPAVELVSYADCTRLADELRKAAQNSVGPYGLGTADADARAPIAEGRAAAKAADTVTYSGTNNHEAGADEPDLVKTDGRRIVTVTDGVLRVVDASTRTETGKLDLGVGGDEPSLLLRGDRALVLAQDHGALTGSITDTGRSKIAVPGRALLLLVELTGAPRIVSRFAVDARLVDARLTGDHARVVVRSGPRIDFRPDGNGTDAQRIEANRTTIGAAPLDAWLPGYEVTTDGVRRPGRVGCDRVRTPPTYSGASLITILTFDLRRGAFDTGEPVTVAADGDTVYATPTSLYVANDDSWRAWRGNPPEATAGRTEIYRFDTATPGRTVYTAAGGVDGQLLNQYSLSEWNGHLRIATTSGRGTASSSSAIDVLRIDGGSLVKVGRVDGLGRGERIYSVRFLDGRAYVVTFRQTDPLYSVDLSNPAAPRVTGELKINGYSAHLQPVGPDRLVGIGQEADTQGRVQGSQVSLFDVKDPAKPNRIAQYHVADSWSEAEQNPHAVLWWPATNLLVVPVSEYQRATSSSSAVAFRVDAGGLTRIGAVTHPVGPSDRDPSIRRTLVVGDTLWTVSSTGLRASELGSLRQQAWLPTG